MADIIEIARVLDALVDCDNCPLVTICDNTCEDQWEEFLNQK